MRSRSERSLQNVIFRLLVAHQVLAYSLVVVILLSAVFTSLKDHLDQQAQANTLLTQEVSEYYTSLSNVMHALVQLPQTQQQLDAVLHTYQTFDGLYVISSEGRLLLVSPQNSSLPLGIDMTAQPFYDPTHDDIFISEMFISPSTGNPTVYLSLRYPHGTGLLVGEINLLSLERMIIRLNLPGSEWLYVIEKDGRLLAYPDNDRVRRQESIHQVGVDARILQPGARIIYQAEGNWMFGSSQAVPLTPWLAAVQVPVWKIFAPVLIPAGIGLPLALAIFALSMVRESRQVRRQVVEPLDRISQAAHDLAQGQYGSKAALTSSSSAYSEITSLVDSFDRMQQAIAARERSLQISEERLRYAMEATSDGIWDWNIATGEVHYSLGYLKILGYAEGEFPNVIQAWQEAIHPEDRESVLRVNQDCIEGLCQNFEVEYRLRKKDGSWSWILGRGKAVVRDENGRAVRMIGTHVDLTEMKQFEIELRASRQQYKSLVDHLKEVVFQANEKGKLIFLNPYWEELTGLPQSACLGRSILEFVHPDDRAGCFAKNAAYLQRNQTEGSHEARIQHADGSIRWVEIVGRLELDGQNRMIGMAGTLTDITERKRADEAVHRMASELEQRVLERTASLEAANKELESFAYSVSHDLRAPLRGIDGWSLALLEDYGDTFDDQAHNYLNRVRAEAQRMGHLIDELLDLSRASLAGVANKKVDLSALAKKVARDVSESMPGRQVQWLIQPDLVVMGDEVLLETALFNLFQNALKFSQRSLPACVEFGRQAGVEKAYYVSDNGVGFDMAYASNLFSPFQRLHKASQYPGSGIGLAIVKRIITRHGGQIWAEGRVGEGATFFFTLEVAR